MQRLWQNQLKVRCDDFGCLVNRWREERAYILLPKLLYYGDHLTSIVMTAYYTGMLRGDMLSLIWDDVDLGAQLITIRAEKAKTS